MSVRTSGLATGYLWTTLSVQRSLLASRVTCRIFPTSDDDNSRQNPQIRPENRKKIFRDKFFSDENLSVSVRIKKNTIDKNTKSLVARLSKLAHVTCLGQWESRKLTFRQNGSGHACATEAAMFPVYEGRDGELSRIVPIWSHLDQNKVSTFVIAQPFCSSDNVLCTCPNFELLEPQFIVVFGDFIFLPGINPESLVVRPRQITQIWIVFKTSGCLLLLLWKWKLSNWKLYFSPCCISCVWC